MRLSHSRSYKHCRTLCIMSHHGYRPVFKYDEEDMMALFIETLTGTTFELVVSPFDTVMSIKAKIQRVEGIPVSQQHLLYNFKELEDSSFLVDYAIEEGATIKLVLSMRGGPISTVRRILPFDDVAWREIVESNREDLLDDLPSGCRMALLVYREGDQINMFRVLENHDGSYSPLSESCSSSTVCNLFDEDYPKVYDCTRTEENSVTMGKVNELKTKLEELSIHRKEHKTQKTGGFIASGGAATVNCPASIQLVTPNAIHQRNIIDLPPLCPPHSEASSLSDTTTAARLHRAELTHVPVLPEIGRSRGEVLAAASVKGRGGSRSQLLLGEAARPQSSPAHLTQQQLCEILSEAGRHRATFFRSSHHCTASYVHSMRLSDSDCWGPTTHHTSQQRFKLGPVDVPFADYSSYRTKETSETPPTCNNVIEPDVSGKVHRSPIIRSVNNSFVTGRSREPRTSLLTAANKLTKSPVNQLHLISRRRQLDGGGRGMVIGRKLAEPSCSPLVPPLPIRRPVSFPGETTCLAARPNEKPQNSPSDMVAATSEPLQAPDSSSLLSPVVSNATAANHQIAANGGSGGNISPVLLKKKKKNTRSRCTQCNKRLTLTNIYTCRCGHLYCSSHRYSEAHGCSYDYKSEGRKLIEKGNPLVTAPKLPKI